MQPIIIIPYRNRAPHLEQLIPALKQFVPSARTYVIEQADNRTFNRGWVKNVGFIETSNQADSYWIFHDVDMIPVTADYSAPINPTHIATRCGQYNYKMPYANYFGGVNIFTASQFTSVNGFVNTLRGWGAEDDILYESFIKKEFHIDRRDCRFENLPHRRDINRAEHAYNVAIYKKGRDFSDGLTSCHYKVVDRLVLPDYTHVFATP